MPLQSSGLNRLEKLYLAFLWLLVALALMIAMTLSANAQTPSASPAPNWKQVTERALDKVEAQNEALKSADTLIEKQKEIIAAQTRLEEIRKQEIDALRRALDAQTQAKELERSRADLADKRASDLEGKLASAKKRSKVWTVVGFVLGIAVSRVL